jgi:hypothetical protein
MTKRLPIGAALAVFALAFVPQMRAAVVTELVLSDSFGDKVTIDLNTTGPLVTVTCNSGGATCGTITTANIGTVVFGDVVHGTINIVHGTLGTGGKTFTLSDTAVGGADSTLPTLQDLNQINANATAAGGTLTSTFTDTMYPSLASTLNVADSNVTDVGISLGSTIKFTISTDAGNAIPAGTSVYTNTLSGHTDDNGAGGVNVVNPNASGSLSSMTVMTFTGVGQIQANVSTSNVNVPEPAGTVLLGTLVIGLAMFLRKKQLRQV